MMLMMLIFVFLDGDLEAGDDDEDENYDGNDDDNNDDVDEDDNDEAGYLCRKLSSKSLLLLCASSLETRVVNPA